MELLDKSIIQRRGGGEASTERSSNLELYRIIVMFLIIAHHYVVNSGLLDLMYELPLSGKSIFLFLFGAWGKTGINCFVVITGYFMCQSNISAKKFFKLFLEIEFYKIVFYLIFTLTGYQSFDIKTLIKSILPITQVSQNFAGCYLLFYLFIPFLNILIKNLTEREHLLVLCLIFVVYIGFGTLHRIDMNYVSWFICLYFIGSYIRLYPKKIYEKTSLWGILTIVLIIMSSLVILVCLWLGEKIGRDMAYAFVADSNTFLAVFLGITSFLFFKEIKIKQSKFINTVASSTFGVLLIHANSDAMRNWLWGTFLNNVGMYSSDFIYLHAVLSVIGIFIVSSVIDIIRMKTLEKPVLNLVEKIWNAGNKKFFSTKDSEAEAN